MTCSRISCAVLLCLCSTPVFAQPQASSTGEEKTLEQAAPEIPSIEELLAGLAGDSAARLKSLRYSGWKLWEAPDEPIRATNAK